MLYTAADIDRPVGDAEVDAAIRAVASDVLDVMNGVYADSLALVARVLGEAPGIVDAEAISVDAGGLQVRIVGAGGERSAWIDFAAPVDDADRLSAHLLDLVDVARRRSGEPGETTAERERRELARVRTFVTSVAGVCDVHPHLRLITLAGGDLADFTPLGPDTFVYVMLPPPGRTELTVGADFTWQRAAELAPEDQPVGAYYTVRAWRPERQELDLLFVLHEPAGAASGWAERARPGDPVALWGPRRSFDPPSDAEWFVLVGDDTGLPALAAIVESLPAGTPIHVVAEVDNPDERQAMPNGPAIDVTWVYRRGAAPGTVADRTLAAVRALELPASPGFVWGSGESRTMTAVRRHVRDERGLPRDRVSLIAYWRVDR